MQKVTTEIPYFTKFAEKAPPERVVEFLNELFSVLSEVVFRHDGMVDKFMGDCVMALFGANQDCEDHSERAAAAAGDMHTFVEASAPAWLEKYGFDVKLGIGLTSGEALVGNLGFHPSGKTCVRRAQGGAVGIDEAGRTGIRQNMIESGLVHVIPTPARRSSTHRRSRRSVRTGTPSW